MRIILICFVVVQSCMLSPAAAQHKAPPAKERRAKRVLAVGNFSFIDSKKPTSTPGALFQISLQKWTVNRSTDPNSFQGNLDGALHTKLVAGPLDPEIMKKLKRRLGLGIFANATVKDSSGVWVLTSGPNRYSLLMVADSLGVFAGVAKQEIVLPKFYLHLFGSGSLNGENDYTALGQIGVMRRNTSGLFTAIGVAAQGSMPTRGIAPVLRLEILDVIALQGGPAYYYKGDEWGYYISVDFMQGLWQDIGF